MVQEQVQAPTEKVEAAPEATPEAITEATEPTPAEGEAPEAEETAEATAEATEPLAFDPAPYEADDSPHRESFQKFRQEERARGWSEARESYSTQIAEQTERSDATDRLYGEATQAYKTLMGRFKSALDNGQVDRDALNEVFQDPNFTRATEAIGNKAQEGARDLGRTEGRVLGGNAAAEGFVTIGAKTLGRPSLEREFIPRIQSAQSPEEGRALVKDFIEKVKDIGYQQGLADNKSGTRHADDLTKRKDEKPAQNVGSAGGGGTSAAEKLRDMKWVDGASTSELMATKEAAQKGQ